MLSESFEDRLTSLREDIFRFAYKLTFNLDDAYDLTQDAIYKALTNKDKYSEQSNLKGWVFTITRNLFINNYRQKTRSGIVNDTTDNLHFLNSTEPSMENPESDYAVGEITNFLKTMSSEYQVPFQMRLMGYKYEEIATKLKLPLGTVKSRIFSARKILQKEFKDYHYST